MQDAVHVPPEERRVPSHPPPKPRDTRRGRPRPNWQTAHDKALIEARVKDKTVSVTLALDTDYTSEEGEFTGKVLLVDVYSVKFLIGTREIWVSKPHIVSTEIING